MLPSNTYRLIGISCLAVFLSQLGIMMYLPAQPSMAQSMNTTLSLTALALPAYLIGMAAPMLLWGKWAAAFGIKPIMVLSLFLFALSSALLAVCIKLELFISLRFMQGLSASGISVMARSLVTQHFKGHALAKALSYLSIAFVVSLGIGQYAGSVLMTSFGWPSIFASLAAGAVLLTGLVYRYLSPSVPQDKPTVSWGNYWLIARHPPFLRAALTGGLGYGIIIGFNTAAPSILQTAYEWSANDYGLLGWAMSLAYLLGALSVNRYVSTFGRASLSTVAIAMMLAGSTVMVIGLWLSTFGALLLWLPYCFIVFGQAINYPISLSHASEHSPIGGPYSMALCGLIHQVVAAVVGVAVGLTGAQNPLWLASTCLLLAIMMWGLNVLKLRL